MAMAAIPFRPYTGVIDTSSKCYQAAKAMLDEGKATKSEAQSESENQLEKLRMLLRMLGKDTSSVDELLKLYEGDEEMAIRSLIYQLHRVGQKQRALSESFGIHDGSHCFAGASGVVE